MTKWVSAGPRTTDEPGDRNLWWVGPGRPVAWVTKEAADAIIKAIQDDAAAVKAVVDELCDHEGSEGFSDGTHDRVASLYQRLGIT